MSAILSPSGGLATFRERLIAQADAELLRRYKTLLAAQGLREGLWCERCDQAGAHGGVKAIVTNQSIEITCRCTGRRYKGQTY